MQLQTITDKQLEILLLLYRFRFLNRHQIQTLLNHEYHHRINSWLSDLAKKEIIGKIYSTKFGENTKPSICFLSSKSVQILKDQKECNAKLLNKIYKEKTRSDVFINHNLFIADIYLSLLSLIEKTHAKLQFFTKTDLENHKYLLHPLPDAYFVIEENKNTKRYFLDIFNPQVPRFVLRTRVEKYFEYHESERWQTKTRHPFPSIFLVSPDEPIKKYLYKYILQMLEENLADISFYLTTQKQIKDFGMKKEIWEKVEPE